MGERIPGWMTKDVDCPWCIAKAGEDCWDKDANGRAFQRRDGVHIARITYIESSTPRQEIK